MLESIAAALSNPRIRWIGFLAIAGAALLAFWPALHAEFAGDDWGFLAMCRHLDGPWIFYVYDHSSSYFYRPHTMLLWWLSVRAFGLHPMAHMALNLALHIVNAWLLAQLLIRSTHRVWLGVAGGALFALHPAAIGTALWLADRFDLLATAAVLWALLNLEGAIAGTTKRRWLIVAALLAAGAKETAVVLPLIAAARLLLATDRSWRWRIATLVALSAPFGVMLVVRAILLQGVSSTLNIHDLASAAALGIGNWLARAPNAFAGTVGGGAATGLAFGALLLGCALGLLRGNARPPASGVLALVGLCVAVSPALVQWPVTQTVLAAPEALINSLNLRFFYLSLSGLLMFAAAALSTLRDPRVALPLLVLMLVAATGWQHASRQRAEQWVIDTSGPEHRVAIAAGRLAAQLQVEPGCRLHLSGVATLAPGFVGFADATMKAQVERNAPLLDCVVSAERSPWFSITRETPCSDAAWLPLLPRSNGDQVYGARAVGRLCYHYFADPAPRETSTEPNARWFQFEGDSFREIPEAGN